MDYREIILAGYSAPNGREYLTSYFIREFRKAEKEHFSLEEFFTGCLNEIARLNNERLRPYYYQLEKRLELGIPDFEPELSLLIHTNGRYNYSLTVSDLDTIQETVLAVYESLCGGVNLLEIRLYYALPAGNNFDASGRYDKVSQREHRRFCQILNDQSFQSEIKSLSPDKIPVRLEFHLRNFVSNGGSEAAWIKHTKPLIPANITPEQKDSFLVWINNREAAGKVAAGKAAKETGPKHQYSEREREALYLFYTTDGLPSNHQLYKVFRKWCRDDYRTRSNGNAKSYNIKKSHLEAVKMRVLKERKKGYKATAKQIDNDISALTTSFH